MKSFITLIICLFTLVQTCFAQNKFELIVFEGSDWCSNCRKFEQNILSDTIFKKYLQENKIELVMVDFPQRKKLVDSIQKQNILLAEKYKFEGIFPTTILTNISNFKQITLFLSNLKVENVVAIINKELEILK